MMSYIHHDRNNEQMLIPITLIRGGTSRGFYFEGKNVPKPGEGLEELVFAVRGSPDPMGMDGLGGDTVLQSKVAVVSPSSRPGADVDYTFIQMFPGSAASLTYKMNCGNISAGVPVFALMKNMVPGVKDGLNTIRVYSTNSSKMMYMTIDVLNGEARVDGDCEMDGVPGRARRSSSTSASREAPSPASSSLPETSWTRSRWTTGPRSTSRSRTWSTPASSSSPRTSVSD